MDTAGRTAQQPPDPSSLDDIRRIRLQLERLGVKVGDLEADEPLSPSLAVTLQKLQTRLGSAPEVIERSFFLASRWPAALVYIDGLVDALRIETALLRRLQEGLEQPGDLMPGGAESGTGGGPPTPEFVAGVLAAANQVKTAVNCREAALQVLNGSVLLLVEGWSRSLSFNLRQPEKRQVSEPAIETVIRGPHEGMVEDLVANLSLIRRRLADHRLRQHDLILGTRTQTRVTVLYLTDVASPALVDEVIGRLSRIEIDGVVESAYVEEMIEDNPWSLFPQLLFTERPDAVVGHLLEGRVAILTDGTPITLVAPTTFWSLIQASEDYYERFWIASATRLLRIFFLGVALLLPSAYVAITTFHQEMLPTPLILRFAAAREGVPFPAALEALIMEISFEILREAGIRLPKTIGQTISIVGALVIGQAAVQAGIVSAPMVIIVALTGIASFSIPHYNLAIAIRLLRFPMILLAGILGLYGVMLGLLMILAHLCSLRSFGLPYLSPLAPFTPADLADTVIRFPRWRKQRRPLELEPVDAVRRGRGMQPSPPPTHPNPGRLRRPRVRGGAS